MADAAVLAARIKEHFLEYVTSTTVALGELTVEVPQALIKKCCLALRDHPEFKFEQLMDLCGVDYADYGISEWQTDSTTRTGFERGVDCSHQERIFLWTKPRFAVVYHLLSITHNHRIRLSVFVGGTPPIVDSVREVWSCADWFEREAFDLYGILFEGHPDLRRILTDYGFIGHPFRKDFPLIGDVEVRYDAAQQRVVYEPVSIAPRTLVPKVIRNDNRFLEKDES